MTRFINFRSGIALAKRPSMFDASLGVDITYHPVEIEAAARAVTGAHLILAIHGFNVSQNEGVRSLTALESHLGIAAGEAFMGVLWPGDFWIPVVNYSWEAEDAVRCGAMLADLLNQNFQEVASISMMSHSLGCRVLLECVRRLGRPAREICITAGAADHDCFERQYASVLSKVGRVSVLASTKDKVLKLAYPAGDFFSDLFGDNDSPFRRALGLKGPRRAFVHPNVQYCIPKKQDYGHGDYFPPGSGKPPDAQSRWPKSASFASRIVRGEASSWP